MRVFLKEHPEMAQAIEEKIRALSFPGTDAVIVAEESEAEA